MQMLLKWLDVWLLLFGDSKHQKLNLLSDSDFSEMLFCYMVD